MLPKRCMIRWLLGYPPSPSVGSPSVLVSVCISCSLSSLARSRSRTRLTMLCHCTTSPSTLSPSFLVGVNVDPLSALFLLPPFPPCADGKLDTSVLSSRRPGSCADLGPLVARCLSTWLFRLRLLRLVNKLSLHCPLSHPQPLPCLLSFFSFLLPSMLSFLRFLLDFVYCVSVSVASVMGVWRPPLPVEPAFPIAVLCFGTAVRVHVVPSLLPPHHILRLCPASISLSLSISQCATLISALRTPLSSDTGTIITSPSFPTVHTYIRSSAIERGLL